MRKTINIWAETVPVAKHGEQIRVTVGLTSSYTSGWTRNIPGTKEVPSCHLHLNTPREVRMLAEYVATTQAANVELYDIDADVTTIVEPSKRRGHE